MVFTNGPGKRTVFFCRLVNALLVLYGFKILAGLLFFSKGRSSIFFWIEPQHAHFVLGFWRWMLV